ncbi:MAG: L,D-transpeptidase family protein [Pseudomonadota bacterium]
MKPHRAIAVFFCALSLSACASVPDRVADAEPAARIVHDADHSQESAIGDILAKQSPSADPVAAFYRAREFQPAWIGEPKQQDSAGAARDLLARAGEQGLRAEDYALDDDCDARNSAQCDIALTGAVLRYAHDVRVGRETPDKIYSDIALSASPFDAAAALNQAMASGTVTDWLAALPPAHPEYGRLVQALALYRGIVEQGGWPALPGKDEINPAGGDLRSKLLARRLAFEDTLLAAIANPSPAQIREAVKHFQLRNGLGDDGRVRGKTLAALNVPASTRVAEIAANMERWRWMPAQLEDRFIAVNVPDQQLAFIQDGTEVLHSKVVVGMKQSPTPILRTDIVAAVVNPPWNIPGDIAARALLPHLRRDPGYLAARHMVVMNGPPGDPAGRSIAWRKIAPADFPYAIRQLPGPATALGALMLDSPNDFDVYLHDTPNKTLFDLDRREISNGCVRVQQIFPLASLAMGDDPSAASALADARKTHDTQRLALNRPLPVYFLYWTAFADADGVLQFRPDLYGRDAPLIAALEKSGGSGGAADGAHAKTTASNLTDGVGPGRSGSRQAAD